MNAKQERFVQEYIKDFNATRAAIRAGYSPKTANEQGCQLLAKLSPHVEAAKDRLANDAQLSALWIIRRLKEEAIHGDRSTARVKALEILAKCRGLLIDRQIVETKPLYDHDAYQTLLQTETIDAQPVCSDSQPGQLPDAAPYSVPRAGLVELPQEPRPGTAVD